MGIERPAGGLVRVCYTGDTYMGQKSCRRARWETLVWGPRVRAAHRCQRRWGYPPPISVFKAFNHIPFLSCPQPSVILVQR